MKGGVARKSFEIKDFSGGQITKSPHKNIDTKYSIDCMNCYSEGLTLRPRDGIAVVNSAATVGNGNGIYNWFRSTSEQWLMGYWGSTLTKMDVTAGAWDGTWDTITAHSASGTAFSAATMYFANYKGVLLLSTESRDRIQKMTISDSSYFNIETGGTGTAPLAKYVTVWKNHAWYLNLQGSDDRIVSSAVNSYNNFTGDTFGSNDIITENDIGLTGSFILNGRMYVTKAFSIHRFTYTGSPSPLVEIKEVTSTIGTRSPRSVKKVKTPEGEVVIFLGADKKLYKCDGQDVLDISDPIDLPNDLSPVYMQAINANYLNRCFAIVHESVNWYEIYVCIGTATSPTHSIVYDYMTKGFWPMDARQFTAGAISDDGSGKRRAYVQGATNGKAFLLNSTNSDDGVAINAYWTSEKLGQSTILQRIDEIEVETHKVVCTPTFAWRADWETAYTSYTMQSNTNSHNWAPNKIDNLIQFKITDNSTTARFKLWTISASERAIGGGK